MKWESYDYNLRLSDLSICAPNQNYLWTQSISLPQSLAVDP